LSIARRLSTLLFLLLAIPASTLRAQDLEPRSYSNLPVGLNFFLAGYAHTTGNVAFDPASPLQDGEIKTDIAVIAYARSLDLWGDNGKFDLVVPYAWVDGSATFNGDPVSRVVDGLGDPQIRLSWNFFGAPAMTLQELRSHPSDVIAGASLRIGVPLGHYDEDRLVNIGTHRWSFKPEVGISKAWGRWIFETDVSATFYTDNDDFFGGNKREQDPIYAIQGHLIYNFDKGFWIALDGTYYEGGETTLNGVEDDNRLSNSRFGLTMGVPLSDRQSLKFYTSTGISSRTGDDFTTVGVVWQYRWGAGMP
jgi:hypothetical protein